MALIKSGTHGSGTPLMAYELHAEQTAGTGTKRTIKMTLKAKCNGTTSASFFGFAVDYYFTVNGTKTTQSTLKSSAKWYGNESYRTFTATVTVDVGTTSSKAITVGFTTVNSNGWGGSQSGSFTVGSTNTAPVWPSTRYITIRQTNSSGTVISNSADSTENAGKFPENISSLYLSWTKPTDAEGGTLTYEIYEQVDNGTFTKIATTTTNSYTRSIGSGSSTQGKMYDYYVSVKDSGGLYASGNCHGTQVQKNKLTVATPTSSSTISYASTSFAISWSGASNTVTTDPDNKSKFSYQLSSPNITVYNQNVTGTSATITIYKSGTVPTGCYVKFDDIKSYLKSSNYNGTITFTLKTTNHYGSSGTKNVSIKANIQTNPTSFTFGSVSGTSTVNSIAYLIPSNKQTTITWGTSSDPLGGAITYDVYYSYDNGTTFTILQSNVTTNTLTKTLPSISAQTSCKFKVTAKTTYGKTTSVTSGTQTLHYVGLPSVKYTTKRNQTNYKVTGTVTIKTSIPNISLSSVRYVVGSTSTSVTVSNPFTITRNLAEGSTESLTIYVRDKANADLGIAEVATTINISRYNPMLSIREKGVGVNCVNSGSEGAMLKVNGKTQLSGELTVTGASSFSSDMQMNNRAIKLTTANSGYPRLGYETSTEDTYISGAGNDWLRLKKDGTLTWKGQTILTASGGTVTGGYSFNGAVTIGGTATLNGATNINNTVTVKNTSSGVTGSLWSGTGGFVVQGKTGYNLHLGANNQTNDMVFYSDKITVGRNLHTGSYIFLGDGKGRLSGNIFTCMDVTGRYTNIYLGPASDGEARVCAWGDTANGYRPIRASSYIIQGAGNWTGNTITHASNGCFASTAGYVVVRSVADSNIYLQGAQTRAVAPNTTTTYRPMYASAFNQSSTGVSKSKIKQIDDDDRIDTMQLLKDTNVYTYHLIDEVDRGYYYNKKIGFIAEATPKELKSEGEQAIDLYSMTSTLWDVCKKQQNKIEEQEKQISDLWEMVEILSN